MPHASSIKVHPESHGLVTVSFSVPSDEVTLDADEVFIRTGTEGFMRIPKTLVKEFEESGFVVFEVRVPSDVAAAVGNVCAELFRLASTRQED
jgi:hypothetical protein